MKYIAPLGAGSVSSVDWVENITTPLWLTATIGAKEVSRIKNIVGASLVMVTIPDSSTLNTSNEEDFTKNISPPVPLISSEPVI